MDRSTRSAALIATAVALPVVLVVAFLIGETGGDAAAPATPAATAAPSPLQSSVPDLDQATAAICGPVVAAMPVTLDGGTGMQLAPLVVTPGGPSLLAWGDPLVTFRCGVERPVRLRSDIAYDPIVVGPTADPGATWLVDTVDGRDVWTTVDREVYLQVTVPQGDVGYVVDISQTIARLLPPVCKPDPQPGDPADTLYCGSRP